MGIQENLDKNKDLWSKVNWDDMARYIGPYAETYRKTFDSQHADMVANGRPTGFLKQFSWHWPALIPLIGIPWAVARKQWLIAGLLVGVIIIANIVLAYLPSASFGFMMFLVPMAAKSWYIQMGVAKIAKIKAQHPEGAARDAAIAEAGGLNMTYGYIAGAICATLLALSIMALVAEF
jgi:CBS domain-containing protein